MEPDGRTTVYVFGYPKSGTTWLARLLGDVLNSPVGAAFARASDKCIASEGQDRPGRYYIRQGHELPSDALPGAVVPRLGVFCWREVTDEKVIYMQRDPRDILISVAHHWGLHYRQALGCMAHGDWPVQHGSGLAGFMRSWARLHSEWPFEITRYLWLHDRPCEEVARLLRYIGAEPAVPIVEAVARQSITARREWTAQHGDELPYGKDFQMRFLRRGMPNSWRDELPRDLWQPVLMHFGQLLVAMGYETGPEWVNK